MSRIDNLVLTDQTRDLAFNSSSFSTLKSITFQIYTRLWALASAVCCPGIQSPSSGWYSWNIVLTGLSASALTVSSFPKQQSECCVKIEVKVCSCSVQTRGMICVLIQNTNPLEQSLPDVDLHCLFHHFLPWTFQKVPVSAVSWARNTFSEIKADGSFIPLHTKLPFLAISPHWSWDAKLPAPLATSHPSSFPRHFLLDIYYFSYWFSHLSYLSCISSGQICPALKTGIPCF